MIPLRALACHGTFDDDYTALCLPRQMGRYSMSKIAIFRIFRNKDLKLLHYIKVASLAN